MLKLHSRRLSATSKLFDQTTFYRAFAQDLAGCRRELIIESPFMTARRINKLLPHLIMLRQRGVQVTINTRHPIEHDDYRQQAVQAVAKLQAVGANVLFTVKHHRKLAIIDRTTIWEGSLNILSYSDSCEIMRRIVSGDEAKVLLSFIKLHSYL